MEFSVDVPPQSLCSSGNGRFLGIGCVDGTVQFGDVSQGSFDEQWKFQTNSSIRGVAYNEQLLEIYAIGKNKSISVFDVETGKRKRCLVRRHENTPCSLRYLPPMALHGQQLATGDESGSIRTWDFRATSPQVSDFQEQEEDINDLAYDSKHNLLSASSDGSLVAFDIRKKKKRVKSETMHSELLSICTTDNYVYVGGGDGFIEVFTTGEYGNLLKRIESGFELGVAGIVELRKGLLLTSSSTDNKLRVLNVMPTKRLGTIGVHGEDSDGIDLICISEDRSTLFSAVSLEASVKIWSLPEIVDKFPILRDVDAKRKKDKPDGGFFEDLLEKETPKKLKKKRRKD
ncbi:unnamed protein product [Caenorhabditis auriculariae]|uniref:WD repeat-containing protein 55 homolog n=1 Tax=Caenorhabditis auriculariae TaxID=2777116 RepID=A0A8S1H4W6_9PELO|nr:unnamed protein product [Caenorhabditis auriculariae]